MRSIAGRHVGSQPIPYTVSVGKTITPPPLTTARASASCSGPALRMKCELKRAALRSYAHACADRDATHRIVGDDDRDAGDLTEQGVEAAQQRAAAGQDD